MLKTDRQVHDHKQAGIAKAAVEAAMCGDRIGVEVAVKGLTLSGVSQIRKALPLILAALENETNDRIEAMAGVPQIVEVPNGD